MCPEKRKHKQNSRNHEKASKSPVSKEFACPMSYFERAANLMSKKVRPANSMSNIEIPPEFLIQSVRRSSASFRFVVSVVYVRCALGFWA